MLKASRIILLIILSGIWMLGCDIRKKDQKYQFPDTAEQLPADTTPPTKVQVIDTVYNFGSRPEGDLVEYDFRFRNVGDKPLVIHSAKASCGCTIPEKPEHPIPPGQVGFIKVKFDSKGRPGQAQKIITVTSNAVPPFPPLILQGDVIGKPEEEENSDKHQ